MGGIKESNDMTDRGALIDELQWKPFPVLDKGFVCLVDLMGDDAAVVQAARVSYGQGTKTVREDKKLIDYLLRNGHTTPFEMCEMKFLVRIPMDAWRQGVRHRTASINEYSTRYSEAISDRHCTEPGEWRMQSTDNKQGSSGYLPESVGAELTDMERSLHLQVETLYRHRLDKGVSREQARKDLPLSTYTEAYWKFDLHNLLHMLKLRMDPHAQKEIREYATTIGEKIVKPLFPWTWEAFEEHVLYAKKLSRTEAKEWDEWKRQQSADR